MSLEILPLEIITLVSSFADRRTLKSLRETHRAFLIPASSRLFREIHISPNSHSFDRALAVADNENLRHFVRAIVYHFGMLGDFYAGFEAFRYEYFSVRKPGESYNPSEITAEVLWCYNCWLEELDAQRTFELRDEEEELQQLCSQFPKIEQITTLLDDIDDIAEPQDYIGLRTGMATSEDFGEYRFARVFRALNGHPLTTIAAKSISWDDLKNILFGQADEESPLPELVLPDTLQHLELGLYNPLEQRSSSDIQDRCEWLDVFLSRAPTLTTLRLDFDELPFESHAALMLPVSKIMFTHHWPQLKDLKLEAIAAHGDELCEFLLAHAAALRRLQLGDIELVESADRPESSSIIQLFRRLQQDLHLRYFRITGNFTNRSTQAWYVDIEVHKEFCLRDLIEDFVCSRVESNSEFAGSNARWTPQHEGWDIPQFLEYMESDDLKDWMEFCDESWYWSPELLC